MEKTERILRKGDSAIACGAGCAYLGSIFGVKGCVIGLIFGILFGIKNG